MSVTILVVEDDAMIREMMHITLTNAGYVVTAVGSGESALDLLKRIRIDLVLLDVQMPRISGLDVLRTMKRLGAVTPPVLMVTADRQADTITEAMGLGCVGYVAKPFRPAALLERVAKALASRSPRKVTYADI